MCKHEKKGHCPESCHECGKLLCCCCCPPIKGATGPTGPTGPQGRPGIPGLPGRTGATGSQGLQGPQGIQGETGPQGATGASGRPGPTGSTGRPGSTGPQGIRGETGPQGIQGETGAQGIQGGTGPQGIQGETGPPGPQQISQPFMNANIIGVQHVDNGYAVTFPQIGDTPANYYGEGVEYNGTDTFTITMTGLYSLTCVLSLADNNQSDNTFYVELNGSPVAGTANMGASGQITLTRVGMFTAGTEIRIVNGSGHPVIIKNAIGNPSSTGHLSLFRFAHEGVGGEDV